MPRPGQYALLIVGLALATAIVFHSLAGRYDVQNVAVAFAGGTAQMYCSVRIDRMTGKMCFVSDCSYASQNVLMTCDAPPVDLGDWVPLTAAPSSKSTK